MAQILKFFEQEHEYQLNGEEIPSVSEISRFASREVYGEVTQYVLDNAAERGTKVHKATELIDKYGECEVDEGISPYIQAYIKFLKEYEPKYSVIEKAYASATQKYAGTLDRVCTLKKYDGNVIIDIKSSSVVQKVLAQIQLNGYKGLYEENEGKEISHLLILHLKNDGTFRLIEIPIDNTLFQSCLNLHNALKKKKRGKKNG